MAKKPEMRPTPLGRRLRSAGLVASACLTACLAVGCGSSSKSSTPSASSSASATGSATTGATTSTSGSPGASASSTSFAQYEKRPAFGAPGPALDAKKVSKSDLVVVVDDSPAIGPLLVQSQGILAAAKASGVKTKLLNGGSDNTPSGDISLLENAANLHPSLIIQTGVIPQAETAGLQYAAAHGAKVIFVDGETPIAGKPNGGVGIKGVTYTVAADYPLEGKLMADYVASHGPSHAQVGVIGSADVLPAVQDEAAFAKELKIKCPGCKIISQNVDGADWGTQMTSTVTSMLESHPGLNYLFPVVDGSAQLVEAGLGPKAASTQVISINATPGLAMSLLKQGKFSAEVGNSGTMEGWYAWDAALRVLLQLPEETNPAEPVQFFTTATMSSLDPSSDSKLFGTAYVSGFKKLWGLR